MSPSEGGGGHYEMGFQLTPLTTEGGLDCSGDFKGGPHKVEDDPLYRMAVENRDGGNKMVQAGDHEAAVGRYSELIMQTRSLENETDVLWDDAARVLVRQLRAAAYLNLSLCFLKLKQWTHANNTATRAIQGDKDPPEPKDDVLAPDKKAKAFFRRAQVQREGFGDLDKAFQDLKKAAQYAPEDKAIQQELQKAERELAKQVKAADKKLAGFLSGSKKVQSGEGIFKEEERKSATMDKAPVPSEPVKMSDGLWVVPQSEEVKEVMETNPEVDYDELGREINELREGDPEAFDKLREQVQSYVEEEIDKEVEAEAATGDGAAAEGAVALGEGAKAEAKGQEQ